MGLAKNLLARTLHNLGQRNATDFISINAASVTPQALEDRLLQSKGNSEIEIAKPGSTIYLDEISEMSADVQVKLLDLLHSEQVKGNNFRFIASTRQTLENLVNEGSFREDLFYRLNVVPIVLPALRDRLGDIGELTQHFLQKSGSRWCKFKGHFKQSNRDDANGTLDRKCARVRKLRNKIGGAVT